MTRSPKDPQHRNTQRSLKIYIYRHKQRQMSRTERKKQSKENSYKADVTGREFGRERVEKKALVFASELISSMDLNVAFKAQSSLISTTYQCSWSFLTHITLYLHLSLFTYTKLPIKRRKQKFPFGFLENIRGVL